MVKSWRRLHLVVRKSRGLRRGIGIISWAVNSATARPESCAADFVGIRFGGNRISARPWWRRSSTESSDRQVKAAPEKVHGAGFADELRPKFLENRVAPLQHAPESAYSLGIIGRVRDILLEGNRIGELNRRRIDTDIDPQFMKSGHKFSIELSDR